VTNAQACRTVARAATTLKASAIDLSLSGPAWETATTMIPHRPAPEEAASGSVEFRRQSARWLAVVPAASRTGR
jgi:hypothetical protein